MKTFKPIPHPENHLFDTKTEFNDMEVYFIKVAFDKLDNYVETNWQDPEIRPHAQILIRNMRRAIQNNLVKPVPGISVSLFTRYFMEYGFKDCHLYATLAACLTQLMEGRIRIFSKDNFYGKLSMFELKSDVPLVL